MSKLTCKYSTLFNPKLVPNKCDFSSTTCSSLESLINFFTFYFCDLNQMTWLYLIILLFLVLLIFRFMSLIVEEYIAPSITYISNWLKMSEALSAVTLLALANGAGDVITAIVASSSPGGISYNIGALNGAGLFVCSLVIGVSIIKSKGDIKIQSSIIYRDVGIYIIATLSTLVFAIVGKITWISSVFMLLIYVFMVAVVLVEEYLERKKNKGNEENLLANDNQEKIPVEEVINDEEEKKKNMKKKTLIKAIHKVMAKGDPSRPKIQSKKSLIERKWRINAKLLLRMARNKEHNELEFKDLSLIEKIDKIVEFPLNLIAKSTVLPCDENAYDKRMTYIWSFTGVFFLIFSIFKTPNLYWIYIGIPISLFIFLFFYLTQRNSPNNLIPKYFILITILSAISGLFWTYILSSILIDLLNMLGVLFKLKASFLGLTIIAVGNALPDALTTIALSKQGYALMGISGAYAGQLFGLLIGFGLAMLKKTILQGNQVFDLFSNPKGNVLDIFVISVALFVLLATFCFGIANKFVFNRKFAVFLFIVYLVFVGTAVSYQIVLSATGE